MFTKLRTVVYYVPDLALARDWYAQITGTTPYFDEPFYVGFDINGFELGLDNRPENSPVPNNAPVATAYWAVDDISAGIKRIVEAGGAIAEDIKDVGEGIRVATLRDPWGNAIGLITGA